MSYTPRYDNGNWIADCDVCGRKYKASELIKRWDGLMCCEDDWEIHQPQDFVRGVADTQIAPWLRPEPTDAFITIPYTEYPSDSISINDVYYKRFIKNINTRSYTDQSINTSALNSYALNKGPAYTPPEPSTDDDLTFTENVAVFTGFGRVITEALVFSETIARTMPAPAAINGSFLNSGALNK